MKPFLVLTAVLEVGAGVALLVLPAVALALLLGVHAPTWDALMIGRLAGIALLAIGLASWLARRDPGGPALTGLFVGLLVYDAGAAGLLLYAGAVLQQTGPLLWPAVVLHALLAVWCLVCLRRACRPRSAPA